MVNDVQTSNFECSLLTRLAGLSDSLSKCLVLCAKLKELNLVDENEIHEIKTFLLSEEDPAKLSFLVRS